MTPTIHATTVLAVRRDGQTAFAADGQVTVGEVVMKHTARKVRGSTRTACWRDSQAPPPTRKR